MSDVEGTGHSLDVHIVTPESEVWSGRARYVLARTASGDLGVLGGHEHTLAVLGAGPLVVEAAEGNRSWAVDGGFLSIGSSDGITRVDVLAERVYDDENALEPRSAVVTEDNLQSDVEAAREG